MMPTTITTSASIARRTYASVDLLLLRQDDEDTVTYVSAASHYNRPAWRRGQNQTVVPDLRVWVSELNKYPHVNRLDLGNSMPRGKKDRDLEENVLLIPWPELVANITRMLIHLPGLTFDRLTPQFRDSLERCVFSSVTIIGLLEDDALDQKVSILSPCGPSIIFQCGLLQVFNQCHAHVETNT